MVTLDGENKKHRINTLLFYYLSTVQIHAELCYAEALLMTALMTFLEDQNLLNLVRGAFRIRACYQSYK